MDENKFNIKLHIKNYKQIGTEVPFEANIEGDVLLITGDNGKGKTGLVNAIVEAWALKTSTPNPLTTGKEDGYKKITIPTLEGDSITIVHNFSADNPTGMFYGIKPDGKVINSVPTLRKIIGDYAPMTVEEFFQNMLSAESRRKLVKNYLVPLMGNYAAEIEIINKQVNENGTLYKQRTDINGNIRVLETQLANIPLLTDVEKKFIANEEAILKALSDLEKELENLQGQKLLWNTNVTAISDFHKAIENFNTTFPENGITVNLLEKLQSFKEQFDNKRYEKLISTIGEKKADHERGTNAKEAIYQAKQKEANRNNLIQTIEEARKSKDNLEKQMEELKEKRSEILKAANIPAGIETDGETITLKGYDFVASQVSYSEAALAIAEVMAQLFTGKIISLGNISEFGPANRKRIFEIAHKYNKLVVVTQVTDESEVKVQAIVE